MLKVFYKYHGAGNDFVMVNGFNASPIELSEEDIATICHRRTGVGADGLIILHQSNNYDFSMRYYNADGLEGTMCGNGGRCAVQFAQDLGIIHNAKTTFEAIDGLHQAEILSKNTVALSMQNVDKIKPTSHGYFLNTGSPHLTVLVNKLQHFNVVEEGKKLRHHPEYGENGTNVNFFEILNNVIYLRTFERGVEDETWACGTGSVATAISACHQKLIKNNQNIKIITKGGVLEVSFKTGPKYTHIWLTGPVKNVFKGYGFVK